MVFCCRVVKYIKHSQSVVNMKYVDYRAPVLRNNACVINQAINKFTLFRNILILLNYNKIKPTSIHVHIANASNAGVIGTGIDDHFQLCSVRLCCMPSSLVS